MTQPFKFRYVNEIAGSFVLLAMVLAVVGVFLAGRAQGWFEPVYDIRTRFDKEGAFGLQEGAEVHIMGTLVGSVVDIQPNESGQMLGVIRIRGPFIQYVRQDSIAIVKKKFAVAGDSYMEITRGQGDPLPEENAFIKSIKDTEITERVEEIIEQVREAVVPAIEQVQAAVEEYTQLAADLRDSEGPLMASLARLEELLSDLQAGQGAAGRILKDPQVADDIASITHDLKQTAGDLREISGTIRQASERLPEITDSAAEDITQLSPLLEQSQQTLEEAEKLIRGIQAHWLIRNYVEQEPTPAEDPLDAMLENTH